METEHFQAPDIIFGSIQIDNNQIEKPSTKELAALKVARYQTTQVHTEDDKTG